MSGWTRPATWWDKVKCFFGYHWWVENAPEGWDERVGMKYSSLLYPPAWKEGWTRECLFCPKKQTKKNGEWKC